MRIVFMGSSKFSAKILESLLSEHEILAVYTKADICRRSGKTVIYNPVSKLAESFNLTVEKPKCLRDMKVFKQLQNYNPDCICVAAYGLLLPKKVLELPKFGCLNVHASLLPQWRGAAPIQRSILSAQKMTGVSIMKMEEGLDTGPYCNQLKLEIEELTLDQLEFKLAKLGASALLNSLINIENETIDYVKQNEAEASYAKKIEKNELYILPIDSSANAFAKFRASNSANPCRCKLVDKEVRITKMNKVNEEIAMHLGNAFGLKNFAGKLAFFQKRLFIGFSDAWLELLELVPAGKKVMTATSFAAGIQGIKKNLLQWEALQK